VKTNIAARRPLAIAARRARDQLQVPRLPPSHEKNSDFHN
jgi:hypothetical protein